MNSSIKIEDIQYGLVLGSDINTVKEALWMTWRAWIETYQLHPYEKPLWVEGYAGECACCEYTDFLDNTGEAKDGCTACPMLIVWGFKNAREKKWDHCTDRRSPYHSWGLGIKEKEMSRIIAEGALELLKKECYGTKNWPDHKSRMSLFRTNAAVAQPMGKEARGT